MVTMSIVIPEMSLIELIVYRKKGRILLCYCHCTCNDVDKCIQCVWIVLQVTLLNHSLTKQESSRVKCFPSYEIQGMDMETLYCTVQCVYVTCAIVIPGRFQAS